MDVLPDELIQMHMSPHLIPTNFSWNNNNSSSNYPMPMMLDGNHGMMPVTLNQSQPVSQFSQPSVSAQSPFVGNHSFGGNPNIMTNEGMQ
jgi:hypothetical protein